MLLGDSWFDVHYHNLLREDDIDRKLVGGKKKISFWSPKKKACIRGERERKKEKAEEAETLLF